MQPTREFPPNKSKLNQGNPRKSAWISLDSFGRFGAFQRVATNPNKKIFRRRVWLRQVVPNACPSTIWTTRPNPANVKGIAQYSDLAIDCRVD
jgi:hypothetical protein